MSVKTNDVNWCKRSCCLHG